MVSKEILAAIQTAVKDAVATALLTAMKAWEDKISALQDQTAALEFKSANLEKENSTLKVQLESIATTSALNAIDKEVYNRKWNVIIHGINGQKNEPENVTEDKVREMGTKILKINNANDRVAHPFAACHRLSQVANSGIIVKFGNLTSKNEWFAQTKNLRSHQGKISISQDLPPILKPLKSELLGHRKMLPSDQKQKTKMIFSKSWPYLSLKLPDGSLYKPKQGLDDILRNFYQKPAPGTGNSSLFLLSA